MSNSRHSNGSGSEKSFDEHHWRSQQNDAAELYVANFPFSFTEEDIKRIFNDFVVLGIRLHIKDRKAFAFVHFSSVADAEKVREEMNLQTIDGRQLIVRKIRSQSSTGRQSNSFRNGHVNGDAMEPDISNDQFVDYSDMPELEPINDSLSNVTANGRETREGVKVLVSNFPSGSSEADILELMKDCRPTLCLILLNTPLSIFNQDTVAFVYLPDEKMASFAKGHVDGRLYKGRKISVYLLV